MKVRSLILFIFTVLILVGLLLVSSTDLFLKERQITVHSLSVIVPDENDDCWVNFKKGMERAAVEYNADISFVTMYESNRASQQEELMLREIENGAQALIVCPANDGILTSERLSKNGISVPVVALGSRAEGAQVKAFVGADRRRMGEKLAAAVLGDSRGDGVVEVVAVSLPAARADIRETYEGLQDGLEGSGLVLRREYVLSDPTATVFLGKNKPYQGKAIVALDAEATRMLVAEARQLSESPRPLYGVGCTNNILRGLEEGAVRAVAVSDGYNEGYLCVKTAVAILDRTGAEPEYIVADSVVRPETVYDREHETLLFPVE